MHRIAVNNVPTVINGLCCLRLNLDARKGAATAVADKEFLREGCVECLAKYSLRTGRVNRTYSALDYSVGADKSRGLGFGAGVVLCCVWVSSPFKLKHKRHIVLKVTTTGLVNLSFHTRLVLTMVWVWALLCLP